MNVIELAQSAPKRLSELRKTIGTANAASDVDAILDEAMTSIVAGFAARMSEEEIASHIGVSVAALRLRLDNAAQAVVGADQAKMGDLIIEKDGKRTGLVVQREFSAIEPGGPRSLGICYPGRCDYNLWEGSDLPNPARIRLRLVRARGK
ncbi:Uncharacterised protein [Mycobacteroides abscessus subsp. bolletii]|uniref:hypothetical protein n=1 Tax=Mycobacteroides abscessus TaxID=36809 RepID=UPI0009A7793B|nr:hypothetical protein [Mycobacteroides abscessus]SKU94151.1 Uncharacterised protein [Mycobacteroides abscessus subsp. bolletii]